MKLQTLRAPAPLGLSALPARRLLLGAGVAAAAALLAGCAGMRAVTSDVSTFGEWPAGRAPGSYAFERLPSQAAQAAEAQALEVAAIPALAKAGFVPVAAGKEPDVLVQVGARMARTDRYPWDEPVWFRGGFGYYRRGPWSGPAWGMGMNFDPSRYERGVAVLVRDRATGKPLYEARAANEAGVGADAPTLQAMFEAALMDFPKLGMNPRRVTVELAPPPPAK